MSTIRSNSSPFASSGDFAGADHDAESDIEAVALAEGLVPLAGQGALTVGALYTDA